MKEKCCMLFCLFHSETRQDVVLFPPLVVQLLYTGSVSFPCWPLRACQGECLLTSQCACIWINKPKAMPALISQSW